MLRFKKILCPVEFFKASENAFAYAIKLAAHYDARVHALHVVAPVMPVTYAPFSVEDLTADLEKEGTRLLDKLRSRGEKARVTVSTEVRMGDIDRVRSA